MKAFILLALAGLSGQAFAADLSNVADSELCIGLATTTITGVPIHYQDTIVSQDEIVANLQARHEACLASDMYLNIARARLQQETQAPAAPSNEGRAEKRRLRADRISQALGAFAAQQAPRQVEAPRWPTTTTCTPMYQSVSCTTW